VKSRLILLIGLAAGAGGCERVRSLLTKAEPGGTEFTSNEGGFRVTFPGPPTESTCTDYLVPSKMFTTETNRGIFLAGFNDLDSFASFTVEKSDRSRPEGSEQILKVIRGTLGMRMWRSESITLAGKYPGQEFTGWVDGKHIRAQFCLVGYRMYMLTVEGKDLLFLESPEANAFFKSFQITEGPPSPVTIRATGGRFKATFPVDPKKTTQTAGGVTFTTYAVDYRGVTYAVGYTDQEPADGSSGAVQARLNAARDGLLEASGATLTESVAVRRFAFKIGSKKTTSGPDGIAFAATAGSTRIRAEVWVVKDRLYRMTVTGPEDAVTEKSANHFLRSLEFVN